VDLTIVPVILVTVLIIALATGKDPSRQRRKITTPFDGGIPPLPADPNNPYYSPQADQNRPPEDPSPPPGF